jgi:2,3-bisphosphoglycerate-dependent phosphoglycerate mutase
LTSSRIEVVYETHSTSEDNEAGIATGWLGGTLSAEGRRQAARLGERRRDNGIGLVTASDLNRAVETAGIAFEGSQVPVRLDWRLRECDYGAWNGMPRTRLEAERMRRIDEPFPSGESWRQAVDRVDGFLEELAATGLPRVLLIGHIATRWALDRRLRGISLESLAEAPFAWQEGWEYALPRTNTRAPQERGYSAA